MPFFTFNAVPAVESASAGKVSPDNLSSNLLVDLVPETGWVVQRIGLCVRNVQICCGRFALHRVVWTVMWRRVSEALWCRARCARTLSGPQITRRHTQTFSTERDNIMSVPLDGIANLHPSVRTALSLDNASRSQLNAQHISNTIQKYRRAESDTGSPEVQGMFRKRALCTSLHTLRPFNL